MSIIGANVSEWLDMMGSTITIDPWVSNSVSGTPTYAGVPVSYPAYIEIKNRRIIDHMGREVMARGRVFLGSAALIDVRDKITLPIGYIPLMPPILAVDLADDELGTHHTVISIG